MDADFVTASMKTAGSLILILGLIIGFFYFLKKLRGRPFSLGHSPQMRLVSSLNLAPKRGIALVEVCDEWLVVGIGTESVTLLSNMAKPEEFLNAEASSEANGQKFHALLKKNGILQPWKKIGLKRKDAPS